MAAAAREVAPQPAVTRLAWLLLADGLVLGALNVAEQYAPLALGSPHGGCRCPVGNWPAG